VTERERIDQERQKRHDWITAIHEAGHVLGARLAGSEIYKATIVPSKRFDGCVKANTFSHSEEGMVEFLLGHAAELEFGFASWGEGHDYVQVEKALKDPIKWRKSEAWAKTNNQKETFIVSGWQINPRSRWDAKTGQHVSLVKEWRKAVRVSKKEWKPEFDRMRRKARRLARKHRDWIERVAKLLMEKRTLTDKEIPELCD
jgi:ATP-dependent Zn protease